MTIITTAASTPWTATLDHRTGATLSGGPASHYQRVARCDGRPGRAAGAGPNYAARRLGALFVALSSVMAGAWLVGEVATSVAGQPVSAAADTAIGSGAVDAAATASVAVEVHVARDGDTLWSIADQHRGDVGRDRYVDALVQVNGATSIQVGQAVILP